VLVVLLLLLQLGDHVVDHLDDLVELALAQCLPAAQRGHEELDANLVLLRNRGQHPADLAERALAHGLVADGDLQEAGARAGQGLLEEVEGVVVVEDLDGVGQGDELLTAELGALLHSPVFVAQPFSSSALNFLSSRRPLPVSSRSSFMATISTPVSPISFVLASTAAVRAAISFSFASTRPLKDLMAASSSAVASARLAAMVSPICLRMPVISPLDGA